MENNSNLKIKKGNFTTTFNDIFKATIDGKKLRPEVWGLYVYMLSLPEDWDFTIRGLAEVVNAGKNKIQLMLKELETAGFIKRNQAFENGKFGKIEYIILDRPELPHPQNGDTGENLNNKEENDLFFFEPCPEIPYPQNRDTKQNTNKQIYIDKFKIKGTFFPDKIHFLVRELISKNVITALDYDLLNFNDLFFKLDKEYGYEVVLTATRYVVDYYFKKKPSLLNKFRWFSESIENNINYLIKDFDELDWKSKLSQLTNNVSRNN